MVDWLVAQRGLQGMSRKAGYRWWVARRLPPLRSGEA